MRFQKMGSENENVRGTFLGEPNGKLKALNFFQFIFFYFFKHEPQSFGQEPFAFKQPRTADTFNIKQMSGQRESKVLILQWRVQIKTNFQPQTIFFSGAARVSNEETRKLRESQRTRRRGMKYHYYPLDRNISLEGEFKMTKPTATSAIREQQRILQSLATAF